MLLCNLFEKTFRNDLFYINEPEYLLYYSIKIYKMYFIFKTKIISF